MTGPALVNTLAPVVVSDNASETTNPTQMLEKTKSAGNGLSLMSGFGFSFGQKTKMKKDSKGENEVTQQEFEQFCYDAVKRVQQNTSDQVKELQSAIQKVG